MSAVRSTVPSWINVRHADKCQCGASLQRGDSGLYEWATQKFLRCHACDPSNAPAPQPPATVTATGMPAEQAAQPWPRMATTELTPPAAAPQNESTPVPAAATIVEIAPLSDQSPAGPVVVKPVPVPAVPISRAQVVKPAPASPAAPATASPAASPLADLVRSIENFASANCPSDIRRVADRMIAAVVRAAVEVQS
jgi:hypothetical protein